MDNSWILFNSTGFDLGGTNGDFVGVGGVTLVGNESIESIIGDEDGIIGGKGGVSCVSAAVYCE